MGGQYKEFDQAAGGGGGGGGVHSTATTTIRADGDFASSAIQAGTSGLNELFRVPGK